MFAEQEEDMARLNEIYQRVNERHEKMKSLMMMKEKTNKTPEPISPGISKDQLMERLKKVLGNQDRLTERLDNVLGNETKQSGPKQSEPKRPGPIDTNISSPGKIVGARAAGFGREELVRQIRERENREKKLDRVPISIPCSDARELRYSGVNELDDIDFLMPVDVDGLTPLATRRRDIIFFPPATV